MKPNYYRNIRRGKWRGFQTGLARTLHTTRLYLHKHIYIIHVYRIPASLYDSRGSNFQRRYKITFFYYSFCPSQNVNKHSNGFIIVTRCNMKRVFEKDPSLSCPDQSTRIVVERRRFITARLRCYPNNINSLLLSLCKSKLPTCQSYVCNVFILMITHCSCNYFFSPFVSLFADNCTKYLDNIFLPYISRGSRVTC